MSHETNMSPRNNPEDDFFAAFENEMGNWGVDQETAISLEGLDRRAKHKASLERQQKILDTIREEHEKQRRETGTYDRALVALTGRDVDFGRGAHLKPAMTTGTGEIYFIVTEEERQGYVRAAQPLEVGRKDVTTRGGHDVPVFLPKADFIEEDVRLIASQFQQLEELRSNGVLPDLSPTGTFDLHDPSTGIMRKSE